MSEKLLELPFEIQAILAIGYVAYRLATTGLNKHHRTGDFVLQVLVYGAIAKLAQEVAADQGVIGWWSLGAALILTVAAAACWRAFGNKAAVWCLRKLKVTRENYSPSAWTSLINERRSWRHVSVLLDDGVWLDSDVDILPEKLPLDPLEVDHEGNIAMYVTERANPDGTVSEFGPEGALDEYGRAQLTYIPASRIKRITVSFGMKQSGEITSLEAMESVQQA